MNIDKIDDKNTRLVYKHVLLGTFLFVLFLFSLYLLDFDILPSLVVSLVFVFFVLAIFQIFVFPEIKILNNKIKKMEQDAKSYDAGTKLLIRRDLELNRANDKLKDLDEAKSGFISVVAHQLRTPLSGVKWTLSMLIGGDMGELNNDQKTFLMKSYESNNRMINLVNDMLAADRVQSGKVRYEFRSISIINLIDNILFELNPAAQKKNISIEYKDRLDNIPNVLVDPDTIRAVMQNLLENAIKYTMDGGKVSIGLVKQEEKLQVSVTDNGIGIPENQKKNIFSKFFRATNAVKLETDGSGLGLNIAQTIIEKNGGEMWFESQENKGTTFFFTIPIAK